MPNSDYTNESSPATALQIASISEKLTELTKKLDGLAELPAKLEKLTFQLESLDRGHGSLGRELEACQKKIEDLEQHKQQIDTVKHIFGFCGLAIFTALATWLNTMSGRIDSTNQVALSNQQAIATIQKEQANRTEQLRDLQDRQRQSREETIALQAELKELRR